MGIEGLPEGPLAMLCGQQARRDQLSGDGLSIRSSVPISNESGQECLINYVDDRCRPEILFTRFVPVAKLMRQVE